MDYNEFASLCDGYSQFDDYVNKLYELGMVTDNCPLMEMYSYYGRAVCSNFGADYAWFLNWASDRALHVKDYNGQHGNVDFWVYGIKGIYEFLQSDLAKEECWL